MAVKKTPSKKAAKKVAAKKAPVKKAPAKKAPAKKTAAKPAETPIKKVAAKKAQAKKAPAKKTATKKVEKTSIVARVDVGFGNTLFIRGEGAGLSWETGTALENIGPYEWSFTSDSAKEGITYKFLINDEIWADGDDLTVAAGGSSINSPAFSW